MKRNAFCLVCGKNWTIETEEFSDAAIPIVAPCCKETEQGKRLTETMDRIIYGRKD